MSSTECLSCINTQGLLRTILVLKLTVTFMLSDLFVLSAVPTTRTYVRLMGTLV